MQRVDGRGDWNRMLFLKHLLRFLKELGEFAWHNKVWWIVPIVLLLLLLALVIFTVPALSPYLDPL